MIDSLVYLNSHIADAKGDPHFQLQVTARELIRCRDELAYRREAMSTFGKMFNPKRLQFPQNITNWTTATIPQPPVPNGYVYFIAEEGDGRFVKIGRAENIHQRLNDLQTGNPRLLKVVRKMPGGTALEKWLHDKFAQFQVSREWYLAREEMTTVQSPWLEPKPNSYSDVDLSDL